MSKEHYYRSVISTSRNSPIVIFIHGLGDSSYAFAQTMAEKSLSRLTFYAPDLFGYGKMGDHLPHWEIPGTLAEQRALELHGWLTEKILGDHGGQKVFLVGHSMGGVIGLRFCETYPSLVRGFINVEGNVTSGDTAFSQRIANYSREEFIAGRHKEFFENTYKNACDKKDFSMLSYCKSLERANPPVLWDDASGLVRVSESGRIAQRLGQLKRKGTSVLFLYGESDRGGLSEHSVAELKENGVELNQVPDSGHWVFLDNPEYFYGAVRGFVKRFSSVFDFG